VSVISSGCRAAGDLKPFAKRHNQEFSANLDVDMPKAPCDSTFPYLFGRMELGQGIWDDKSIRG
jgi:hypothetical protein